MLVLCALSMASAAPASTEQPAAPTVTAEAIAARRSGDATTAARLLGGWLASRPDDVDARLHYGYALLDLGRLQEAEHAFAAVLQRSPAYADARIGLARTAQRQGDLPRARQALAPLPDSNKDARVLRGQLHEPLPKRWTLDVGTAMTRGGELQDWRELNGQLRFEPNDGTRLTGQVEATHRFGLTDVYSEAQVFRRFSAGLNGYLLAGAAPGADYRPVWQVGGGSALRVRAGRAPTNLTFDLRFARYRSGKVASLQPGVEQYLFGGRAWATGRVILVAEHGRVHRGVLGRVDVQATHKLRVFAGAADAPDTSEGVVSRSISLFGGLEAELDPRRSLRLSLGRTGGEAGLDRTEMSAGIATRF